MSNKPRRRKAHSAIARDQRLFSQCRVWTWEGLTSPASGQKYTTAEKWTPFGWIDMGHDLASHLLKYPRNWSVSVRALCHSPDGAMWMESRAFDLPSYTLKQIEGSYHQLRADVMSAQRTAQVYDLGWICQTWHGTRPEDPLDLWQYQYAPEQIIRKVTNNEKTISRMKGPGFSQERYDRWQLVNQEYLEQRKRELKEESAA